MATGKCSACGYSKTIDDQHLGKKTTCPKCKGPITVMEDTTISSPSPDQENVSFKETHHETTSSCGGSSNFPRMFDNSLLKFLAVILVCITVALSFTPFLDEKSDEYFDKALNQAAASFAVSKTLNGIISVVQDTDITANFGVGFTVGLGEALDPVNDIVEKFSYVMFISTVSLGVQKIISAVGRCFFVKVALTIISLMLLIVFLFQQVPARDSFYSLSIKLFLIFAVLRFAMPVVSLINEQIYVSIIQQNLAIEEDKLTILADEIANLDIIDLSEGPTPKKRDTQKKTEKVSPSNETGIMDSMGKMWNSTVESTGSAYNNATTKMSEKMNQLKGTVSPLVMKKKIDELTKKISEASTYLVNLAIIFVFQTIVSPLIVLWGLLKLTGYLMNTENKHTQY